MQNKVQFLNFLEIKKIEVNFQHQKDVKIIRTLIDIERLMIHKSNHGIFKDKIKMIIKIYVSNKICRIYPSESKINVIYAENLLV